MQPRRRQAEPANADSVRALGRHVLQGCGYTVLAAGDGEEALRVADRHYGPIHLLVTDVVMPGLGGRALAEMLGARQPALETLYVSGYAGDEVFRHCLPCDELTLLQKPFSPVELAFKVRNVLDRNGGEQPTHRR